MQTTLHPIKGRNGYCGPAAMASVLGISTDDASATIRRVCGLQKVAGLTTQQLVQALTHLGCEIEVVHVSPREQLPARQWVTEHADLFAHHPVIIVFSEHFGTLLGRHYQCSMTLSSIDWGSTPIPLEGGVLREVLVVRTRPDGPLRQQFDAERRLLHQGQRLASKHGVIIERDAADSYLVRCPELEDDDPHEGHQTAATAQGVLAMVKDYVHCLQNGYLEAVTDPRFRHLCGSQWVHPASGVLHAGAH